MIDAKNYKLRCINYRQTKYDIPFANADKYICTPSEDYLELNAYMNKMADVFKDQFLKKVGP